MWNNTQNSQITKITSDTSSDNRNKKEIKSGVTVYASNSTASNTQNKYKILAQTITANII